MGGLRNQLHLLLYNPTAVFHVTLAGNDTTHVKSDINQKTHTSYSEPAEEYVM